MNRGDKVLVLRDAVLAWRVKRPECARWLAKSGKSADYQQGWLDAMDAYSDAMASEIR